MDLSKKYLDSLKNILKDDFADYLEEIDNPPLKGLRINTLKCDYSTLSSLLPFSLVQSPFAQNSFYIPKETAGLGKNPLHHAGAFYLQEPSASSAVTALDIKKGDFVLDLCAAPGGKSTQIAEALCGKGLLWSNEYVKSRVSPLLSNIERLGIKNAVVTNLETEVLCTALEGLFDKVLVDAPCSGEGMFRKEPKALQNWSEQNVKLCSKRQLEILKNAKKALKPGGIMVYSTCTFSLDENEKVIESFLNNNPEFSLDTISSPFGRSGLDLLGKTRRIFPMDGGEGHFVARLIKNGQNYAKEQKYKNYGLSRDIAGMAYDLYTSIFLDKPDMNRFYQKGDNVFIAPENVPKTSLSPVRVGVHFGTVKKNRIEPAHGVFMTANKENLLQYINLSLDDDRLYTFLKGGEISVPENLKGYVCVLVCGISTGFGKAVNGRLKNKYPKGLRNL